MDELVELFMEFLSWLLVVWLSLAAFVFLIVQKLAEFFPARRHTVITTEKNENSSSVETVQNKSSIGLAYSSNSENVPFIDANGEVQHKETILGNSSAFSRDVQIKISRSSSDNVPRTVRYDSSAKESVNWLNEFVSWFLFHYRGRVKFFDLWIHALSDAARKICQSNGYDLSFDEALPVDLKTVPHFGKFSTESGPRESLNLRGHLHIPEVKLKLTLSKKTGDVLLVSRYEAQVFDLEGNIQIRFVCLGNELLAMMCFDGNPSLKMHLYGLNPESFVNFEQTLVEDLITRSISAAITNMTFSGHDQHHPPDHQDHLSSRTILTQTSMALGQPELDPSSDLYLRRLSLAPPGTSADQIQQEQFNRLLVKVLRAENLQEIETFIRPYVVVELDEPAQKHTTSLCSQVKAPAWDEHFLFDVDPERSQELLFEVYAKSTDYDPRDAVKTQQKFLGLAILGIDEVKRSLITHQPLPLQPRPFIKDRVSGLLYIECLFVYASKQDHDEDFLFQELEMHTKLHGGHVKTTIANKDDKEVLVLKIPELPEFNCPSYSGSTDFVNGSTSLAVPRYNPGGSASPSSSTKTRTPELLTLDGRGRRRTRPSFFDGLREKLHMGAAAAASSRAQSLDRAQPQKTLSPTDVTYHPPPRSTSSPKYDGAPSSLRIADTSPGCSDSEMSCGSSEALHTQSKLIIERMEGTVKKYYYIPAELKSETRAKQLIKSGKKLHIYNNHTFVSVKLPSSTMCKVCQKSITSTFKRQGYQCRDCKIMCHRRCYTKVDSSICLSSRFSNLTITPYV